MKALTLATLLLSLFFGPEEKSTVQVTLKITNIADEESNVMVAIFDHHSHFLTEEMYRNRTVSVNDFTETEITFNVEPGEYAIAIFQDMNLNGDLDRNMFMFPSEPFGFSKNYRPILKAPHWTDVAFDAYSDQSLEIELN